ncbi:hypothetical protein [Paracraurococcus lichenis]|uniref:Uncharacterized protein n=1 Tax=Paracraurococcus lichenis TaxID=3064888 RepID=A0ABT9E968_9PROT|nr:hypothetical protein [Paracraurococcus sp. LOR1-02]MDO9712485.1 hypothetical protein [Paracraurococcus sp. LOR1-02]
MPDDVRAIDRACPHTDFVRPTLKSRQHDSCVIMRRVVDLARAGGPLDQDHVALVRELLTGDLAPQARCYGERCPSVHMLGAAIGRNASTVMRKLRHLAQHGYAADDLWHLRRHGGDR